MSVMYHYRINVFNTSYCQQVNIILDGIRANIVRFSLSVLHLCDTRYWSDVCSIVAVACGRHEMK